MHSGLIGFVLLYLAVTIAIGLFAATRVRNSKDYVVAGRSLPLYITIATVFATWFGAETVLGISSTFLKENLRGVVADPFGSSLCLVIVGVFFAAAFYRMNLLTIGDYYRERYNRVVEVIASLAIVASYLGWTSAQVIALGLVFNILSVDAISLQQGMLIGASIVVVYTLFGGMWSVALTDFFQMILILLGMVYIAFVATGLVGGVDKVITSAVEAGKFEFWPKPEAKDMLWFFGAWITMMLGSVPQQDVFQRVTSAKNVQTARRGTIIGAVLYFIFAFIPMYLAYTATLVDPVATAKLLEDDSQKILPSLVLNHMPIFAQVMFFGALLSAIMSTASGALLAPSVTFTNNILRGAFPGWTDKQFLWAMRFTVVGFSIVVLGFAWNSDANIFKMVENAYKVTLVTAFVPLAFGLAWKRANVQGAMLSIILGAAAWLLSEAFNPEGLMPPQLVGLLWSIAGMIVGSLLPAFAQQRALAKD
ncbi:MAG TPA: sodium:solute symporter family protein [Casimicrobiaceae bacterium]|nr:sodium:solute symporter family protein [Casimicrobiaceae bacterium]